MTGKTDKTGKKKQDDLARVKRLSLARAEEVFGEELPKTVEERLSRELSIIKGQDSAGLYLAGREFAMKARERGLPLCYRSSFTGSFLSFLLGISYINPLPPMYTCKDCGRVEFPDLEGKRIFCGADLPIRTCPTCGKELKKDGYDIPVEAVFGVDGEVLPDLHFETVGDFLDGPAPDGWKKTGEEKVRKDVLTPRPGEGSLKPDSRDFLNAAEIRLLLDFGCTDPVLRVVTYEKALPEGKILTAYGVTNLGLELIYRVSGNANVLPKGHFFQDRKVVGIFGGLDPSASVLDGTGILRGALGLPIYGSKAMADILSKVRPEKFSDLVRIVGMVMGKGAWKGNGEDLVLDGIARLDELVCSREDVMTTLTGYGVDPHAAAMATDSIWKKDSLPTGMDGIFLRAGVPDWFLDSCRAISHLVPRAGILYHNGMAWQAAWYKIYYPHQFYQALFDIFCTDDEKEEIRKGRNHIRELADEYDPRTAEDMGRSPLPWYPLLRAADEMYTKGGVYH